MRDAVGGTVTIVIIVFFIVFALGYLALNVNYTKAFRMRDRIISMYDDFEGNCGSVCEDAITSYARKVGYSTNNSLVCYPDDDEVYENKSYLYCVAPIYNCDQCQASVRGDNVVKVYYKIQTNIHFQIPVVSNILKFRFLNLYGTTRTYKLKNVECCSVCGC